MIGHSPKSNVKKSIYLLSLTATLSVLWGTALHAQSLQITSPASGAVLAPGSTTTVVVALAPGVSVRNVIIIGQTPIGFSEALTSPPFQFPITIPMNTKPGIYSLTADATGAQGQDLKSPALSIDVEPSTSIIGALQIQPELLNLDFTGDQSPIAVIGTLPTGRTILTESNLITYATTNPNVATVSKFGVVTATGPGTANVTASGPGGSAMIPVSVPNAIRGDLNGDGAIDQTDINILLQSLNMLPNGATDARDLNHDGKIDALDARVMTTLCTRARCAIQ